MPPPDRVTATAPPAELRWLQALHAPQEVLAWSLPQWQHVIRLARRLRLLGRLAEAVEAAGLTPQVPPEAARHLLAESRLAASHTRALLWALERLPRALGHPEHPLVLLKGAAYIGQALPIGRGRLPSDIDILVPHAAIDGAVAALREAGWAPVELDTHDQRYYREWSHEVPPMRHPVHALELDLHHNILPPVARTTVDARQLFSRIQPSTLPPWQVLCPADQVLHSAAHLFFDSELRDRVRDLVDLDALLRHFGHGPGFWSDLSARARELGLRQPLALALHFCRAWLATPVPDPVEPALPRLSARERMLLVPLFAQALWPHDPEREATAAQRWAASALLLRHHLWRMPLRLLVPHLWHKLRKGE